MACETFDCSAGAVVDALESTAFGLHELFWRLWNLPIVMYLFFCLFKKNAQTELNGEEHNDES